MKITIGKLRQVIKEAISNVASNRWHKDGSFMIKSPGYHNSNWIKIETPRRKDIMQSALDATNIAIAMLKLTHEGTDPDVERMPRKPRGGLSYEEIEISSHQLIAKKLLELGQSLGLKLKNYSFVGNFASLEQKQNHLIQKSTNLWTSNLHETILE